jgi:plastocyanin
MFNTAAKIELSLAAAALIMAVGVAVAADDPGGFVLLFGVCIAVALAGLAVAGSGFRDRAPTFTSAADAPPVQMVSLGPTLAARPSPWPLSGALAVGILGLGLALGHTLVAVGLIAGLFSAAGWLSQAWREDPSFTAREGARVSSRLLTPFGLPLMAVGLIAVVVISVSRILLSLPRNGSIAAAFLLAILLLAAFFVLSSRPHLGRNSLVFLGGLAVVAVVSAGSVSAASGYRTFDHLETGPAPLTVVAHNTAFAQKTITVTEGQMATITFKNLDPIYHNVAVYSSGSDNTPFWNGEPIRGVKKITYTHTFDMAPGTYTFRCDFHPTSMIGTFVVQAAADATGTATTTTSSLPPATVAP